MSIRPLFQLCLVILALATSACVSTPKQIAFNRGAEPIKTIQVLPLRHSEVDLMILNNPGYSFGLIGFTIAEVNRTSKRDTLREHAAAAGLDHVADLRAAFDQAMSERGYAVRWSEPAMEPEKGQHAKRGSDGFRKTYAAIESVDAILDLSFGMFGYVASGTGDSAPYRPTAVLIARLLSADGKRVLFSDFIIYNNAFNQKSAITLQPDPAYAYPDFDDLDAAGATAIEGLRVATREAARTLAKQL